MTLGLYTVTASIFVLAAAFAGVDSALMWSLMPISGALIASGLAYAFNPVTENRKIILGRLILALLAGVGFPRFTLYWHPEIREWNIFQDPIMVVMFGSCSGLIGYISAPSFMKKMFNIVPGMVDEAVDSQVKKFASTVARETVDQMKKTDKDGDSDSKL